MTINEWTKGGYYRMKETLQKYCTHKGLTFDEDVYHLTLLKMLEKERSEGLRDNSQAGIDNYLFRAFTTNTLREMQYPRVARTIYTDDISKYVNE